MKIKVVGYIENFKQTGRVFDPEGIAPALRAMDYKDSCKILVEDSGWGKCREGWG